MKIVGELKKCFKVLSHTQLQFDSADTLREIRKTNYTAHIDFFDISMLNIQ